MEATPHLPLLDAFMHAAARGPLLWAASVEGRLEVCSGATPAPSASDQVGQLFVMALRRQFGDAASAIAERECALGLQPRRILPARTVRRAAACAESAFSLLSAQAHLLQIEFSAVMMGWRFRRLAESLGLDPGLLSPDRRQALDAALAADFCAGPPVDAAAVTTQLRALLTQAVH
ncbi:hypothetical protein [Roseateles sp.]|uniref:hypothetical protein n=1 Tax=Roseateles sp. TaxID=1971397 RepID=UPI003BAB335D